jgi:hypothetical protein
VIEMTRYFLQNVGDIGIAIFNGYILPGETKEVASLEYCKNKAYSMPRHLKMIIAEDDMNLKKNGRKDSGNSKSRKFQKSISEKLSVPSGMDGGTPVQEGG